MFCVFIKVNCSENSGKADGKNARINRSNFVLSYVLTHSKSQCVELSKSIKLLVLIAFAQHLGCKRLKS